MPNLPFPEFLILLLNFACRKARDLFKIHAEESQILSLLNMIKEDIWPKGQLNTSRTSRTQEERTKTRHTANQKLSAFMPGGDASISLSLEVIYSFCRPGRKYAW